MCAITGILGSNSESDIHLVLKMTRLLAHRGPDDEGFHSGPGIALGHRRLSVIDLESGRQPLCNEDGTVWVVFNGEIYNFQELQKDLEQKGHRFKTKTDTEVIVHLYEEYENFLEKLDGMFAFALWDGKKKKLILARDRLGKKPLFYSILGRKLYFASELKSLMVCPEVSKDWDLEALHHFLSLNYVPAPFTLLRSVRKIKPGHFLTGQNDIFEEKCYWEIPVQNSGRYSREEDALEALKTGLLTSVKKRLISDVPLGMFLSSGIDSSLVLSALAELGQNRIKTFTIGFKDQNFDETEKSRIIAKYFNTEHHEYILEPNLTDLLPKMIWHSDEPSGDSSCFPTYLLSLMARQNITVALSGDGGDEFFGGYNVYTADFYGLIYRRLPMFLRKLFFMSLPKKKASASSRLFHRLEKIAEGGMLDPLQAHYFWNSSISGEEKLRLYSPEIRAKLLSCDTFDLFQKLSRKTLFKNPLDLMMYMDQKTYLTDDILVKTDRMSMAHGLEVRSPLLDTKIIELSYQIPQNLKVFRGEKKYILKKLLSSMIPPHLFSKKKKGFSIPVQQWLRTDLKDFLKDHLHSQPFAQTGLFDMTFLSGLMKNHFSGKTNQGTLLWSLMCLSIWNNEVKNLNPDTAR